MKIKLIKAPYELWKNLYGIVSAVLFLISIPFVLPGLTEIEIPMHIRLPALVMHLNGWYVISLIGNLKVKGSISIEGKQMKVMTVREQRTIDLSNIQTLELIYGGYRSFQKRFNRIEMVINGSLVVYYVLINTSKRKEEMMQVLSFLSENGVTISCRSPQSKDCQDEELGAWLNK